MNCLAVEIEEFDISEYEPGLFGMGFCELSPYFDFFESRSLRGEGYDWEAVVRAMLNINSIELVDVILDPESDGFAAYSSTPGPLYVIAGIIYDLSRDEEKLDMAIQRARQLGYFDDYY